MDLDGVQRTQSFAYEKKGDSAVIWRCFSRDTRAMIPEEIDGLPVAEVAPYAFSAHMDEAELTREVRLGRLLIGRSMLLEELFPELSLPEGQGKQPACMEEGREKPPVCVEEGREKPHVCVEEGQGKLSACTEEGQRKPLVCTEEMLRCLPSLVGERLEEVVLPDTVQRVGRYCFYNCGHLRVLSFTGNLRDWGSGVFTGCHRIARVVVTAAADGTSMLKDMLDEVREGLMAVYTEREAGGGERCAHLMFPEFYEEGVENTPARILETHVHGSGILYRNCFKNRRLDFHQYDELFPYTVARESGEFVTELVLCRLRFPVELTEKARARYTGYLLKHPKETAEWLVQRQDVEGIRWMLTQVEGLPRAFAEAVVECAGKRHLAEALGIGMDYLYTSAPQARRRRRFEL